MIELLLDAGDVNIGVSGSFQFIGNVCFGGFMALLDIQMVVSSLQYIGGGLSAAQDDNVLVPTTGGRTATRSGQRLLNLTVKNMGPGLVIIYACHRQAENRLVETARQIGFAEPYSWRPDKPYTGKHWAIQRRFTCKN